MAFRVKRSDRTATEALRRLARNRIDHAIAALGGAEAPAEALHTARVDIKKLRALLALVRPGFADWTVENTALRDAGRAVSALRDRSALVECHDRLMAGRGSAEIARFAPLRAAAARPGGGPAAGALVAGLVADLANVRRRVGTWQLDREGYAAYAGGLAKSYARARVAMARARTSHASEDIHSWRKGVKAHLYQTALLAPIRPKKLSRHRARADELGERLGDLHDLATYRARLADAPLDSAAKAALTAIIEAEQARLEARVFALGRIVLGRNPGKLKRRWRHWWKRWRD